VFVESDQGLVLDANPAACRLHGLSKDRLVGIHVTELVPPSQREAVVRDFPLWFSGALQLHEGYSYTADGRIIPVELKASRIEYRDEPALLLLVRDISERRSGEDRRTATVQGLRAIVDIADDLIACPDMDALLSPGGGAGPLAPGPGAVPRFFCAMGVNAFGTFGTTMDGETSDERSHRVPHGRSVARALPFARAERAALEPFAGAPAQLARRHHAAARGQGWVAVTPIQTASKSMGVFFNDSAISRIRCLIPCGRKLWRCTAPCWPTSWSANRRSRSAAGWRWPWSSPRRRC
jgi:PAS domain S-box-containing protein